MRSHGIHAKLPPPRTYLRLGGSADTPLVVVVKVKVKVKSKMDTMDREKDGDVHAYFYNNVV